MANRGPWSKTRRPVPVAKLLLLAKSFRYLRRQTEDATAKAALRAVAKDIVRAVRWENPKRCPYAPTTPATGE